METGTAAFELIYNLSLIKVEQIQNERQTYRVHFSNEVPELKIRKLDINSNEDWDTIPAGNKELATGIGRLIEERQGTND